MNTRLHRSTKMIAAPTPSFVPTHANLMQHASWQQAQVPTPISISPLAGHNFSTIPVYYTSSIQAKLTINTPGDKHEQEADRVAEQIMRMPASEGTQETDSPEQGQQISIQRMLNQTEKL